MLKFYQTIIALFLGLFLSVGLFAYYSHSSAPLLANYYLGTLPTDATAVSQLAKNDLLILSPEQALVRGEVIAQIKRLNPDVILFAYVPSESYNTAWEKYPASTLYKDFAMQSDWWLRDSKGGIISDWPGLKSANLSRGWSDYMINFVKNKILTQGVWDGIFWDMVYDGISSKNGGDVDLNNDGAREDAAFLNREWIARVNYLLEKSRNELKTKYLMINGSSVPSYQTFVNGRMYENYPTPWEPGGWSGLMNGLKRLKADNRKPQLYVFNANTGNTGKSDNYRRMRFGLTNSLLFDDVYFSFDYGTEDHSQAWWYDEYNVKLGEPLAAPAALGGGQKYAEDVWRRDYTHGIAVVNATWQSQEVDLGGEYEKIIGRQDPAVNDGSIVSRVRLGARDGLIMLKTFQSVDNVVFNNGAFLRFFFAAGARARNGFFAFEEGLAGGAKVWHGDLDGLPGREKIVASGLKLQIFNTYGERWYNDFPLEGEKKGALRLAVGDFIGGKKAVAAASSASGKVTVLDYHGSVLKNNFYPLDKKYKGGFSAALGRVLSGGGGQLILGTGGGRRGEVLIYDDKFKLKKRFFPYDKKFTGAVAVAAGNVLGDGRQEVITVATINKKARVRVWDSAGKKLAEFNAASAFGNGAFSVSAADVNFDGLDEIVVMSGS